MRTQADRGGARTTRSRSAATATAVLVLGLASLPAPAPASADALDDALAAARMDVEEGRCDRAAARLEGFEGLAARARLVEGQCQIRAGLYPEALATLDRIRGDRDGLSPEQVGDVELYRAVALYHLERYAEARSALAAANGLTRDEAQLSLYTGLLALRDGDVDRAAPALESAARLAPELTEPVASYYAGLAWQGASERNRAREAFQRVVDLDGDGPWGKEAKKLLASTELFPYFVRGRVGIEWDDNVLLRGDVTQIVDGNPLTIAGEDDFRGVWELDAGIELFRTNDQDWSGGLTASYTGNAHVDLADVNIQYPTVGGYVARRLGLQTFAEARYDFGFAWVDEESYLRTHTGEVSLRHTWTRAGTTLALVDILANDLRFRPFAVRDGANLPGTPPPCPAPLDGLPCSPPGVDERTERDRDGIGYGFAVEHSYLVPVPDAIAEVVESLEIAGGYRFRYYDSDGDEWQHAAHLLSASVDVELPLGFGVGTGVVYTRRDFENPSTFPDVEIPDFQYTLSSNDREEDEVFFVGELRKDLTENLWLSGRYSYLNNDSNSDAYNYDRHIVGGYLNFRFD